MTSINEIDNTNMAMTFSSYWIDSIKGPLDESRALPTLPVELLSEIAACMENPIDVANMRLVGKRFCNAVDSVFLRAIVDGRVLYPRYASLNDFLSLIAANHVLPIFVSKIVLVSEGLKEHEYGYDWAWEQLQHWERLQYTEKDIDIINKVNQDHADDIALTNAFINGGGYRTTLAMLLGRLPNLRTIEIRKLRTGEHNSGWDGPESLKELSFYREDLNTNPIFYGDWQYDTVHNRVTVYTDEFGEEITEPDAGPQASFFDDLVAAAVTSGTKAKIVPTL